MKKAAASVIARDPETTHRGILDMQVCVPKEWTDQQVVDFANADNPCGTKNGWVIRRQGQPILARDKERVACEDRHHCVHLMLDA